MIQVFITVMHLFSFIGISNSGRLTGRIFELFHRGETLRGSLTPAVLSVVSYRALALMTLTIEGFLAFRFWVPMLRPFALLVGSLLRFRIDLLMSVTTFNYRMLAPVRPSSIRRQETPSRSTMEAVYSVGAECVRLGCSTAQTCEPARYPR